MFHGSFVALITPFKGNTVDLPALRKLVQFHHNTGTHGFVPVGTTGEATALTEAEYEQIIATVVTENNKRLPVIAGAGSNNPIHAIKSAKVAANQSADAVLHVAGYYNRPNQEGIYQHFKALNSTTDLPIFAYNVPPRTIVDIEPTTMSRLAALEHVIGVKDATCDLSRPIIERLLIQKKDFVFLSGEDPTAVAYNASGGQGCISVTANIAPALCAQLQNSCIKGDFDNALSIQRRLMPLHRALFREPSPAGVKFASALLGLCESSCRLPIVGLTDSTKQEITRIMRQLELI